jgi:hypothetical protein
VLVSQAVVDRVAGTTLTFEQPCLHHLQGVAAPCWLSTMRGRGPSAAVASAMAPCTSSPVG